MILRKDFLERKKFRDNKKGKTAINFEIKFVDLFIRRNVQD